MINFLRILFGNQGGFPFTQDDFEFLQKGLFNNVGMLAAATCLNRNNIIFGNAPLFQGDMLAIDNCYVLLNGNVLACAMQSVAGTDYGNFWMVSESEKDTPLQFLDGNTHNTREVRSVKIVYSDSQPEGGIRISNMSIYGAIIQGQLIKPLVDELGNDMAAAIGRLSEAMENANNALLGQIRDLGIVISEVESDLIQRIENNENAIRTKVTNVETAWVKVNFASTKYAHYIKLNEGYDGLQYRKNKHGNVEIRGTFVVKPTPAELPSFVFALPDGFRPTRNQTFSSYVWPGTTFCYGETFTNGEVNIRRGTLGQTDDYCIDVATTIFL